MGTRTNPDLCRPNLCRPTRHLRSTSGASTCYGTAIGNTHLCSTNDYICRGGPGTNYGRNCYNGGTSNVVDHNGGTSDVVDHNGGTSIDIHNTANARSSSLVPTCCGMSKSCAADD